MIPTYTEKETEVKNYIIELLKQKDLIYSQILDMVEEKIPSSSEESYLRSARAFRVDIVLSKMKAEGLIRRVKIMWRLVKNPPKVCHHCNGTGWGKRRGSKE